MKKEDLRIVFMGTPEFAVPSLQRLVRAGYNIVGVITTPDKHSGRGKKISASAIKQYAINVGLNLLQPENLKSELFIEDLKTLKANLQVVVAFRMLPEIVWAMPTYGTFNLHASLLPQYRGAAPINHAILNGEKMTGLTTFFLDAHIDTGKIIKQRRIQIGENEDAGSLHDGMMQLGARLVEETIELICNGNVKIISQSELISSDEILHLAPKLFKANCRINWEESITKIHDFIRGLSPYPTAFTYFVSPSGNKVLIKIFKTSKLYTSHNLKLGQLTVNNDQIIRVAIKGGFILVYELQLAGKRRMSSREFTKGFVFNGDWEVE